MFASYCMPPHLNSCNRICKYTDKHHNVPIEVLDHSIDSRIDIVMLVDPCMIYGIAYSNGLSEYD